MTQASAPMSPAIKFITGLVLVMTVVILIAGVKVCGLLLGGAVLATVAFFCYLYAPIAYELTGDQLTVQFRVRNPHRPPPHGAATLGQWRVVCRYGHFLEQGVWRLPGLCHERPVPGLCPG
jgi:hypothetical protein